MLKSDICFRRVGNHLNEEPACRKNRKQQHTSAYRSVEDVFIYEYVGDMFEYDKCGLMHIC